MLDKTVQLIGFPKKNGKIPAHINCTVAGWGKTGVNKPASKVLKEATEQIQFNFECNNVWRNYFNEGHMICTKFDRKKGSFCQVHLIFEQPTGNRIV